MTWQECGVPKEPSALKKQGSKRILVELVPGAGVS